MVHAASSAFHKRQYCDLAVHGDMYGIRDDSLSTRGYYEQLTIWIHEEDSGARLRKIDESLFEHRIFAMRLRRIAVVCLAPEVTALLHQFFMNYAGNVEFASAVCLTEMNDVVLKWCEHEQLEVFALERDPLPRNVLNALFNAMKAPHFRDLRLRIDRESFWFLEDVVELWKSEPTALSRKILNLHVFGPALDCQALFEPDLHFVEDPPPAEIRKIMEKFDSYTKRYAFYRKALNGRVVSVFLNFGDQEVAQRDHFSSAKSVHLYFS